jgi:hypothetical protein
MLNLESVSSLDMEIRHSVIGFGMIKTKRLLEVGICYVQRWVKYRPKVTEQELKKSKFVNLDDLSESTMQKEKQFVEVELDEQCSLTDEYDDRKSSRDSKHQKESYSFARGKEKHDQKARGMALRIWFLLL